MVDWATAQRGIFAGESGGDYSALFNYQNKPGGLFENTDVTRMTIGQLKDFTNPGGEYARYVKKTNPEGVLSTPLGAYQVVGRTLKDAVKALNISDNEVFNQATQDKIGRWIFDTQGTGAWQGYKAQTAPRAAPGMFNQSPQRRNAPMQQNAGSGLLANLGLQKMQPGAAGETGQRFFERDSFKDFSGTMANWLNSQTVNPDQNMSKAIADIRNQRTEKKRRNKTVEYLRKAGMGDIADMAEAGGIGGQELMSAIIQQRMAVPKQSAKVENYKYAKEVLKLSDADALKFASSGTNIDMSSNELSPFAKKGQEKLATLFSDLSAAGQSSKVALGKTQVLEQLLQQSDTGFGAGLQQWAFQNLGIETRSEPAVAAQAIIAQLVPQQRAPGSGTMSDADLDLYKNSLPSIYASPGGNQLIIQSMKAISQYNVEVGKLADRALYDPEYTPQMAKEAMNQLPDPLAPVMAFIRQNNITPTKAKEFTQDEIDAYEILDLPLPGSN